MYTTLWQIYSGQCVHNNFLSESVAFCTRCDKHFSAFFPVYSFNCCSLAKRKC